MKDLLNCIKVFEPIAVKNCPRCDSSNIGYQNYFDFKYEIFCKDCGFTQWHLRDLKSAIETWNNASTPKRGLGSW